MADLASTPSVLIELRLEAEPLIQIVAATEGEALRLGDWLDGRDDLAELVWRAVEIADQRAA